MGRIGIVLPSGRITAIPGVYPSGDGGSPIAAGSAPAPPSGPPYFTVTVTPDTQDVEWDESGAMVNGPIVLNVAINRFNGYAKPVMIQFPWAVQGWGEGSSVTVSAGDIRIFQPVAANVPVSGNLVPQVKPGGNETIFLDNVPDAFTISFSGSRNAWVGSTFDPSGYQGTPIIFGHSMDYADNAMSNGFHIASLEPYFFIVWAPDNLAGGWSMPTIAWDENGHAFDPINSFLHPPPNSPVVLTLRIYRVNGHNLPVTVTLPSFLGMWDVNTAVSLVIPGGDPILLSESDLSSPYSFLVEGDLLSVDITMDCGRGSLPMGTEWQSGEGVCISATDGIDTVQSNFLTVKVAGS